MYVANESRREGPRSHRLPDDFVGLEEERRWDGEAQSLGGLEIDDQLELRRLLLAGWLAWCPSRFDPRSGRRVATWPPGSPHRRAGSQLPRAP
jgi:hypothetical protein